MDERNPVSEWATDFDHLTDEWRDHSIEILADLRERCPVASTDRFFGAYLVTRFDDVADVARRTEVFSSRITMINDSHPDSVKLEIPPITLDPPHHGPIRRALLPAFNPREVDLLEPFVVETTNRLIDDIIDREFVDGAADYAQIVPVEAMAHLFGVPSEMGPQFARWVDQMLKEGVKDVEVARKANREIQAYFAAQLADRREHPADDLVTMVLNAEAEEEDGTVRPFTERERIGALFVLLLGGVDTTWSFLGSSLMFLGSHPGHLQQLRDDPTLLPSAVEELLRYFAPVTIARVITEDSEIAGCPVDAGKRLMLSFQSANRDNAHFDRPDEVIFDRQKNRHMAFGVGIHRCLGSNLARMEVRVALETWLARIPRFELTVEESEIEWSVGAVRGPLHVPLRILK